MPLRDSIKRIANKRYVTDRKTSEIWRPIKKFYPIEYNQRQERWSAIESIWWKKYQIFKLLIFSG